MTPRGAHFYIKHPGYTIKPRVKVVPSVDIRGDGSIANVIGTRKDGGIYQVLVPPINSTLYTVTDLPKYIQDALLNGSRPKSRLQKAQKQAARVGSGPRQKLKTKETKQSKPLCPPPSHKALRKCKTSKHRPRTTVSSCAIM